MASPVFTAIGIPDAAMHRGDAASPIAAVFDVVVHEKGIVQHFQAGGGGERILRTAAQRTRGRDAQRGSQAFARSLEKIPHEPVKVPLRFPGRYSRRERIGEHVAVPAQALKEARRSEDVAGTRQRLGDLSHHRLGRRQHQRTGVSRPGRPRSVRARPEGRDR